MKTMINNSLSISIESLVDYVLKNSDHDPAFSKLDPIASIESQKTPLKRKAVDYLKPIAKRTHIEPSSHLSQCPTTIHLRLGKGELIESIKQTYEQAKKCSLEKIYIHYADQFNVDVQEIENIYLATSSSPTAIETSVINTKSPLPVKKNLKLNSTSKETMVNCINRIFHKTNRSLEEIQKCYADKLKVDIQEIEKIYLAASTHCPTVSETSVIPTKTLLPVENTITMTPDFKKYLVKVIDQIFDEMKTCSLKKIQTQYAKHFKLDLQEVKEICCFFAPPP